ncbi:GNAT family N-acetyltransferase [Anoxybacterium hadale]|uniref:GNAT family N-acetyltransferase n=1 Tax=Anoxybacterium hadale TaxID=3408580 RepID=A0ACD1AGF7_9FIRM|nr:GNAT family N-acetyltransferase [Clostridiales bacterium]
MKIGFSCSIGDFIEQKKGIKRMNEQDGSNKRYLSNDCAACNTEMRIAKTGDLEKLKLIWKLCFGDEDQYIDTYFNYRNWKEETAVLLKDGQIVSMLSMIPADIVLEEGTRQKSAMIYGVATHPDHQKMGLADELMRFCNQYLAAQEIGTTFLVPAGESLFRFYEKRGYKEAFYLCQRELTGIQARKLEVPDRLSLKLCVAEPVEYNAARRSFLAGSTYIDYRDEEIRHQKRISNQSGGDLYLIQRDGETATAGKASVIGCAVIEQSSELTVIKELLAEEQYLASAVKHIGGIIPADRYLVRTPAFSGRSLGGIVSAFGMVRINNGDMFPSDQAYLGIAFD